MNSNPTPPPTPEEIVVCAYLIWEHEGRPEGHALQHWLQAEAQMIATHQHEQQTPPARKPRAGRKVAGKAAAPPNTGKPRQP